MKSSELVKKLALDQITSLETLTQYLIWRCIETGIWANMSSKKHLITYLIYILKSNQNHHTPYRGKNK